MKPFHIMAKPHGAICNLDCTYCYYLEKENLYPGSGREFRMADDVLETTSASTFNRNRRKMSALHGRAGNQHCSAFPSSSA
jgi:sulfatase maturation enzyme AslB (radical SAM superfamily)